MEYEQMWDTLVKLILEGKKDEAKKIYDKIAELAWMYEELG